jgi:hypothetical protein
MVRGSGAAWDLRRAQPYECYSELDFDIPIGKNGDNYDPASAWNGGDAASRSGLRPSCVSPTPQLKREW